MSAPAGEWYAELVITPELDSLVCGVYARRASVRSVAGCTYYATMRLIRRTKELLAAELWILYGCREGLK
jgi:hypothetical protein